MFILKNMKIRMFCNNGNHKWHYYTAGNRYLTINGKTGFWNIPMRCCDNCERYEEKRENEYRVYDFNYKEEISLKIKLQKFFTNLIIRYFMKK